MYLAQVFLRLVLFLAVILNFTQTGCDIFLLFSQFPNRFIFSLIDFLIRKRFRILVKGALIIFANGGFAGLNGFAIFIALFGLKTL